MVELGKSSRLRTLATVMAVVAVLYLAREVLIPFALAALLSFFLAPLARRLGRGLGRTAAVVVVVTVACGAVAGLTYVVVDQLTQLAEMIPKYRENITSKLGVLRGGALEKASEAVKQIEEDLQSKAAKEKGEPGSGQAAGGNATADPGSGGSPAPVVAPGSVSGPDHPAPDQKAPEPDPAKVLVVEPEPSAFESLGNTLRPLLGPLGTGGMVVVLVLFMLLAGSDLRDRLVRLAGRGRITMTTQAMDEVGSRVSRYLLMQTLINGIHGLAVAAGMFWLEVPNFLLWGLLSAVLRFVPYVGPILAAAMPILVSLAVFDDWAQPLSVVAYFVVLELLSNNLLEPWLYGASAGVSPLAVIVMSIFWAWLWGPIGLLLATPLTVCMVVIGKHVAQFHFINILLGDEPVLEPHARFYQRLVAMDRDEAFAIAEKALHGCGSLIEVYDTLVIPALGLAESDGDGDQVDEQRSAFIQQTLHEIVDGLPAVAARIATPPKGDGPPPSGGPAVALPSTLRVLALPANDEADELVGRMLAQCVRSAGGQCEAISLAARSSGIVDVVQQHRADVVCVSAVPPSALTHARHVYKRLAARFPEQRLLIGLWNSRTPPDEARQRLTADAATPVANTLREALVELERIANAVAVQAANPLLASADASAGRRRG